MVSVSEVFKAWKESLANKDSSKIGEFFADDFVFIRPTGSVDLRGGTRTRQETLDWTAAGGSPTTIDDNLEVVIIKSTSLSMANRPLEGGSMCDDQISE